MVNKLYFCYKGSVCVTLRTKMNTMIDNLLKFYNRDDDEEDDDQKK